jgi:hypothetical protein
MTNWLLLISTSTMMIFLQTCGSKSADSGTASSEADTSKTVIVYDSITNVVDTVRFVADTSGTVPANEAGTKPGKTEKVPATNPVKKDIPDHRSPDQIKIDSIKKAKEKLKKKSDNGGEEEDKG